MQADYNPRIDGGSTPLVVTPRCLVSPGPPPHTRLFTTVDHNISPPSLPLCQIRKNGQHGLMTTPSYGFENPSFLRYITSFEPRVQERCDTRGT